MRQEEDDGRKERAEKRNQQWELLRVSKERDKDDVSGVGDDERDCEEEEDGGRIDKDDTGGVQDEGDAGRDCGD